MSHTIQNLRQRKPMWFYEKNYCLLMRLLPSLRDLHAETLWIGQPSLGIKLSVLESCRYTQILELHQHLQLHTELNFNLRMNVRVYHDARLVEVFSYQAIERLLGYYRFPSEDTSGLVEKRQANLLLHDWLTVYASACKQHGETIICR